MNERTEIAAKLLQALIIHYGYSVEYPTKAIEATDTLLAELAKTEPKPTQRPWKVGDKVRIIKEGNNHNFKIGEVVKLAQKFNDSLWSVFNSNNSWWISEEEAELVTD